MFTQKEIQQITEHGLTPAQIERQLENFRQGFPFLRVVATASPDDGITMLSATELQNAVDAYAKRANKLKTVKFVPASGAATRMFKEHPGCLRSIIRRPEAYMMRRSTRNASPSTRRRLPMHPTVSWGQTLISSWQEPTTEPVTMIMPFCTTRKYVNSIPNPREWRNPESTWMLSVHRHNKRIRLRKIRTCRLQVLILLQ